MFIQPRGGGTVEISHPLFQANVILRLRLALDMFGQPLGKFKDFKRADQLLLDRQLPDGTIVASEPYPHVIHLIHLIQV